MGLYFGISIDPEPWLPLIRRQPDLVPPEFWHVTLLHMGDASPGPALRALKTVAANTTAFTLTVGPVFHLPQGHTCLAVDPVKLLARIKARLFNQWCHKPMQKPHILPHVTLYKRRVELNDLAVGAFNIPVVSSKVTGISLFESKGGVQRELAHAAFPVQKELFP